MKKVYLSPSNQYNNVGVGYYGTEKERMTALSEVVGSKLRKDFEVMIPNYDSSLENRAVHSDSWGSDIYVALHSNAGGGQGSEIYAYSQESEGYRLAQCVYNRLEAITPSSDRGIKFNRLYETRTPNAPAILIEVAFHDNWEDASWIMANMDQIGTEIAKGIYDYFGMVYEEAKPVEVEPTPEPISEPIEEQKPEEPIITPIPNEKPKKWYITLLDLIIELLNKITKK